MNETLAVARSPRGAFHPRRVVAIAKGVALVRGKLSKAQVVAYLLADTLGIEILEGEAMRLGENATKDAVAAKDGAQKLRNVVWDLGVQSYFSLPHRVGVLHTQWRHRVVERHASACNLGKSSFTNSPSRCATRLSTWTPRGR